MRPGGDPGRPPARPFRHSPGPLPAYGGEGFPGRGSQAFRCGDGGAVRGPARPVPDLPDGHPGPGGGPRAGGSQRPHGGSPHRRDHGRRHGPDGTDLPGVFTAARLRGVHGRHRRSFWRGALGDHFVHGLLLGGQRRHIRREPDSERPGGDRCRGRQRIPVGLPPARVRLPDDPGHGSLPALRRHPRRTQPGGGSRIPDPGV